MDDAIGGDDVLLQHHLDAVNCQAVAIAADLYGAALSGLKHRSCHDGFRTLGAVQQVVVDQGLVRQTDWSFRARVTCPKLFRYRATVPGKKC